MILLIVIISLGLSFQRWNHVIQICQSDDCSTIFKITPTHQ